MKTKVNKIEELEAKYEAACGETMGMLAQIEECFHDQPAPGSDGLTWGNLANVNELNRRLREVLEFFGK